MALLVAILSFSIRLKQGSRRCLAVSVFIIQHIIMMILRSSVDRSIHSDRKYLHACEAKQFELLEQVDQFVRAGITVLDFDMNDCDPSGWFKSIQRHGNWYIFEYMYFIEFDSIRFLLLKDLLREEKWRATG